MSAHPIPRPTAEEENFRLEPLAPGIGIVRRDAFMPLPVGTIVAFPARITGYTSDCDGSLMASVEFVDKDGEGGGWEENGIGLYPDSVVWLDEASDLFPAPVRSNPDTKDER